MKYIFGMTLRFIKKLTAAKFLMDEVFIIFVNCGAIQRA